MKKMTQKFPCTFKMRYYHVTVSVRIALTVLKGFFGTQRIAEARIFNAVFRLQATYY